MDASIVVLTDGEVQRCTWFWDKLFPRFARGVPYAAKTNENQSLRAQIAVFLQSSVSLAL